MLILLLEQAFLHCVVYLPFVVFLPALTGRTRVGSSSSLVSVPPKLQCKPLSLSSLTQLSFFPALPWKWILASPLWKCCRSAEWEFFSGELRACVWATAWQRLLPWGSLCIIGNYEGVIIVLQLHCLLHLFRWLLYGTVFQLGWNILSSVKLPKQLKWT